jgi:hypothetical protein
MTAISGRRCLKLSRHPGPLGSLVKTFLESSAWNSTVCFLTWKESVTPAKRLLFRLVPSMPDTEETECGLWSTIVASASAGQGNNPEDRGLKLQTAVKLWPTPRAEHDSGKHRGQPDTLHSAIKMWPTPHSTCATGPGSHGTGADNLQTVINGSLNPQWVEWLMGYPIGHTALDASATQSYLKSRKSSQKRSTKK